MHFQELVPLRLHIVLYHTLQYFRMVCAVIPYISCVYWKACSNQSIN